jgi:hypothetical protein
MPNPPRTKITTASLCSQFYQLGQIDYIIFDGCQYKLDWEKYNSEVRNAQERMRLSQRNIELFEYFHNQRGLNEVHTIPHEPTTLERSLTDALADARSNYLDVLEKCDIIDEDDKICGVYFTSNKEYKMVYRRFVYDGILYYRDNKNNLLSYLNSYRGHLKDDGETIEGCICDDDDDDNDDDNNDEDANDADEDANDADDDADDDDDEDDNVNVVFSGEEGWRRWLNSIN